MADSVCFGFDGGSQGVRRALVTGNPVRAAIETIGGGLLSGNAFVGGMSLTPWLGFGRLIGRDFLQ